MSSAGGGFASSEFNSCRADVTVSANTEFEPFFFEVPLLLFGEFICFEKSVNSNRRIKILRNCENDLRKGSIVYKLIPVVFIKSFS